MLSLTGHRETQVPPKMLLPAPCPWGHGLQQRQMDGEGPFCCSQEVLVKGSCLIQIETKLSIEELTWDFKTSASGHPDQPSGCLLVLTTPPFFLLS